MPVVSVDKRLNLSAEDRNKDKKKNNAIGDKVARIEIVRLKILEIILRFLSE